MARTFVAILALITALVALALAGGSNEPNFRRGDFVGVPSSVNWTAKGVVGPVQDEGDCPADFAIVPVDAVASALAIKTGSYTPLSYMEVVQCGQGGACEGGTVEETYEYIQQSGICAVATYPNSTKCESSKCPAAAHISSYTTVGTTEADLMAAVAAGPVAAGVDASAWIEYTGGVFSSSCGSSVDHDVLVVGYGTVDGTDVWIIQNTWGIDWGMNGYILLERGKNLCGILNSATFPVLDTATA